MNNTRDYQMWLIDHLDSLKKDYFKESYVDFLLYCERRYDEKESGFFQPEEPLFTVDEDADKDRQVGL